MATEMNQVESLTFYNTMMHHYARITPGRYYTDHCPPFSIMLIHKGYWEVVERRHLWSLLHRNYDEELWGRSRLSVDKIMKKMKNTGAVQLRVKIKHRQMGEMGDERSNIYVICNNQITNVNSNIILCCMPQYKGYHCR